MMTKVETVFVPDLSTPCALPVFLGRLPAGFPSPADDYIEGRLDLNRHLIKHPAATFFVRVTGDSMIGAGIHSGELLVVDRSLEPVDGNVVVAVLDGDLTVKRLQNHNGALRLISENPIYQPIEITDSTKPTGAATSRRGSIRSCSRPSSVPPSDHCGARSDHQYLLRIFDRHRASGFMRSKGSP